MKEPTVEINLPHVYKLVEATRDRTLDDNERETLKLVVDAVGQQVPPPPTRSSEKTRKVLKSEEPGRAKDGDEEKRGHGRHGADDFPGARRVDIPHQTLQVGCPCPECGKGKLRTGRRGPAPRVRFTGQPPIQGTVYGLERLECNLCDSTFTAEAPEEVGDEKYDASVTAVLAVFKYGRGIPFNRIEAIQAQAGIPLPASTQWEILEEDAQLVKPAYDEMTRQAAQPVFGRRPIPAGAISGNRDSLSKRRAVQRRHLPRHRSPLLCRRRRSGLEGAGRQGLHPFIQARWERVISGCRDALENPGHEIFPVPVPTILGVTGCHCSRRSHSGGEAPARDSCRVWCRAGRVPAAVQEQLLAR